ncbi:MAG: hypothetical protein ACD_20C00228G0009 [uncultured bacterium]|nr:MAG: hypothetical protein ACD_20C00228G0009 [uncultured bacterium]
MKTIVLMAGGSEDFAKEGYKFPKYLLEINGKPLLEHVINSFSAIDSDFIFIVKKEDAQKWHLESVIKLLVPDAKVFKVEKETKGAACTALFAIDDINNDEPLLITNGDQILDIDYKEFSESFKNKDGGAAIFESVHPRWSYVKLDENGHVVEASEKRPISKNATAGTYYYSKGSDFVKSVINMIKKDANVNGLYYVCPAFNEMILEQKKISTYKIPREHYHSIANVEGLKQYEKFLQK